VDDPATREGAGLGVEEGSGFAERPVGVIDGGREGLEGVATGAVTADVDADSALVVMGAASFAGGGRVPLATEPTRVPPRAPRRLGPVPRAGRVLAPDNPDAAVVAVAREAVVVVDMREAVLAVERRGARVDTMASEALERRGARVELVALEADDGGRGCANGGDGRLFSRVDDDNADSLLLGAGRKPVRDVVKGDLGVAATRSSTETSIS
jgi:hypothetical protein